MRAIVKTDQCPRGGCLPLAPGKWRHAGCHRLENSIAPPLPPVGTAFIDDAGTPVFMVSGQAWLPGHPALRAPLLLALEDIATCERRAFCMIKTGYALAAVTMSDKGARQEREDLSGPLMVKLIGREIDLAYSQNFILPDDADSLSGLLAELAWLQKYDIICTSGGTGVGPRDITPEATARLLDKKLPGMVQAMLGASMTKTPNAIISRAEAGIIGGTLVINLPGSPKAVKECLEPILPAFGHLLAKLSGDPADCGGK